MNRGSADSQGVSRAVFVRPSMRPRFMNRGSITIGDSYNSNYNAFNEAPIHESGKSPLLRPGRLASHLPSMRPRFMNRGSPVRFDG